MLNEFLDLLLRRRLLEELRPSTSSIFSLKILCCVHGYCNYSVNVANFTKKKIELYHHPASKKPLVNVIIHLFVSDTVCSKWSQ
jgi:hypothetical protein